VVPPFLTTVFDGGQFPGEALAEGTVFAAVLLAGAVLDGLLDEAWSDGAGFDAAEFDEVPPGDVTGLAAFAGAVPLPEFAGGHPIVELAAALFFFCPARLDVPGFCCPLVEGAGPGVCACEAGDGACVCASVPEFPLCSPVPAGF